MERPYASSIRFIFSLCMKSNKLAKSTNNSIVSRIIFSDDSMNSQNLKTELMVNGQDEIIQS